MPKEPLIPLHSDEMIRDLKQNFEYIGHSKTRLSRWNLTKVKHRERIKGYIDKMSHAALLDKPELAVNNSRNKARNAKQRQWVQEMSLIEKAYKGVSSIFYVAIVPVWQSIAELVYYHRRPLYNALRLGLALLIIGSLIAAMVFFPPIIAPILLEITALLGNFYLLGTGVLAIVGVLTFRLIFTATTMLADRIELGEGYYLSTPEVDIWQANTNLSEDTLKIMKQYILNTAKEAPDRHVKFTLIQLLRNEFTVPAEGNLKKLAVFFMHQLEDLRKEQAKGRGDQDEQLELDIKVVTFILDELGYLELLPRSTRKEIKTVIENKSVSPVLDTGPLTPSQQSPALARTAPPILSSSLPMPEPALEAREKKRWWWPKNRT